MDRISDLGLQQTLLAGFQRAQNSSASRQVQLATGQNSDRYSDLLPQTSRLLSAEGVIARAGAYENAAQVAGTRFELQEAGISSISDVVGNLRSRIVSTLASDASDLLLPEVATATNRTLTALNTQLGGTFIFGGTDGVSPAIDLFDFEALVATTDLDGAFNDAPRVRLAIEEGVTIDGGSTAREIGQAILSELKVIGEAPVSLGQFSGPLTDQQRQFLITRIDQLDGIAAALNRELGLNGISQSRADEAVLRSVAQRDLAQLVVSDIEDVDLAEVISGLNQDQVAIEAAGRALAQASQLSLLNFI